MKLKKTDIHCVVVATGACWGNLLGYLRSLGSQGVSVYLVGVDCDLEVAAASRYCAGVVRLSGGSDQKISHQLLSWRMEKGWSKKPVLFFVSDRLGWMFCSQRVELEKGFIVPMPGESVLGELLRKDSGLKIACRAGLTVPETFSVLTESDFLHACEFVTLPVVLKPLGADTVGKINFKAIIVRTREELCRVAGLYWSNGAKFVVQKYIPGDDVKIWVYQFYRSKHTGLIYEWTGRKLRQSPAGAGIMASGVACPAPQVSEAGRKFVLTSDYWGCGGIEFKEYEGELFFIEMNPRTEGFHAMAAKDGLDLPALAYAEATGQALSRSIDVALVSRYADGEAYLGALKAGRLLYLFEILVHIFKKGSIFPIWCVSDPMPFIMSLKMLILKKIIKNQD